MKSQPETTRPRILPASVVFLILGSIVACTSLLTPTPTPIIGYDKAIELAIGACKIPHLVLVGEPKNIRIKFLSLEEADKLTKVVGETNNYGKPMDTMVWLVQMDGQLQLVGGPVPEITVDNQTITPTPPQPFLGTCTAVLDANSGDLIFVRDIR